MLSKSRTPMVQEPGQWEQGPFLRRTYVLLACCGGDRKQRLGYKYFIETRHNQCAKRNETSCELAAYLLCSYSRYGTRCVTSCEII